MRKVRLWHRADASFSKGKYALVDDEDYELVVQWHWGASKVGHLTYAINTMKIPSNPLLMHRLIMEAPDGQKVDHVNGNGIDNRRQNLRFATASQNGMNSAGKPNHRIGRFKGVMWEKERELWAARIKVGKVYKNLGRFESDVEAAKAYNKAALEHFGEFAFLNDVRRPQ